MAGTIIPADLEIDMDSADPDQPGDIKVVKGTVIEINNCDSTTGWSLVGSSTGGVYIANNVWTSPYSGVSSIALILPPNSTGIIKYTNPSTSISIYTNKYIKCRFMQSYYNKVENCVLYFGESTYNEQSSTAFSIPWTGWTEKSWNISAISTASRDAVTRFGLKAENTSTDGTRHVYLDYIIADPGPSKIKAFDGDATIQLYPKFQSGIYTATTEAPRTITLNKSGTPSHIRIQNITTGDATANDEVVWYSGMTQYYAARTGGAVAPSTDMVIDVGDSYFTVATDDRVNQATRNYGYCVMWNDTTG